jgi:hypothetical protein
MNRLAGNPALLFLVDQEPWLCGAASRRLCLLMRAVYCNVRTFGSKDKARCIRATAIQHIAGGATRIAGGSEQKGAFPFGKAPERSNLTCYGLSITKFGEVRVSQWAGLAESPSALSTEIFA